MTLKDLAGTRWVGESELWLDPLGNKVETSDCSIELAADAIRYKWSYQGKPHTGSITLREGGADFTDTFHSEKPMPCDTVPNSWCLVDVLGLWGDGPQKWGWRIYLSRRPDAELVLQMTIIKPTGEDGRAVRMICRPA